MITISFGQVVPLRSAELFTDLVQPLVFTLLLPPRCWAARRKEKREHERLHCIECSALILYGGAFTIERLWLWKLQRDLTTVDVFSAKMEVHGRISTSSIASVAAMLTVMKCTLVHSIDTLLQDFNNWYLIWSTITNMLLWYHVINYSTILNMLLEIFCWGNRWDNKIIGDSRDSRDFRTCQTVNQ